MEQTIYSLKEYIKRSWCLKLHILRQHIHNHFIYFSTITGKEVGRLGDDVWGVDGGAGDSAAVSGDGLRDTRAADDTGGLNVGDV